MAMPRTIWLVFRNISRTHEPFGNLSLLLGAFELREHAEQCVAHHEQQESAKRAARVLGCTVQHCLTETPLL